jgi:hypothetical protein
MGFLVFNWFWGLLICSLVMVSSPSPAQNLVFTPTVNAQVGRSPQSLAAGDFNVDGFLDLATINSTSDDVSILLGNGNGTFRSAVSFGVGKIPMSVATADLDGDSLLDLVVALSGSDKIVVLKGRGDGLFDNRGDFPSGKGTTFLALDDIDGNTNPDIIAVNSGRFGYYPPFSLSVLLNNGEGHFKAPVTYETEGRKGMFPTGVFVGDINSDGLKDLALTWSQPSWRTPNGLISILVNKGEGEFSLEQELRAGNTLSAIAGADLNHDNRLDLIVTSIFSDSIVVLLQQDDGQFQRVNPLHVGFSPVAVAVGDLNGDNQLDLAVTNRDSNSVSVLLGNGTGTFRHAGHFGVGRTPSSLLMKDLDRDGLPDLMTADSSSHTVSVLLSGEGAIPLPNVSTEALIFEVDKGEEIPKPQIVRLSNIGLGPLRIVKIDLVGQKPNAFTLMEDHCLGSTLGTGDSCTLHIAFTSQTQGSHNATVTIWDNANGSPRMVILRGTVKG